MSYIDFLCAFQSKEAVRNKDNFFLAFLLKQTKTSTAKYNTKSVTCVQYPATSV